MMNSFRQGILSYPINASQQAFLAIGASGGIDLTVNTVPVNYTVSHGNANYLYSETSPVLGAWLNVPNDRDVWLYWDIDRRTAVRTFGFTQEQPVTSATEPTNPREDTHWYNLSDFTMYVFQGGGWRSAIRLFAARFRANTFYPLGNDPQRPYAGSQIGLQTDAAINIGRVLFDDSGLPILQQDGNFFTTGTRAFVGTSLVNNISVEATLVQAKAMQPVARYTVAKYANLNEIVSATYNDTQSTAIAMTLNDASASDIVSLTMQGVVTNPDWSWPTVGVPLWISDDGTLTLQDLNLIDTVAHPVPKPPVARVISATQVFFDQNLSGRGERGLPGTSPEMFPASNVKAGISYLSVAPQSEEFPIAVGDNDPRLTGPRTPTRHSHPSSEINTVPTGSLSGNNLSDQLQEIGTMLDNLELDKLNVTGGEVGPITSDGTPITDPRQFTTKEYVDTRVVPVVVPPRAIAYGAADQSLTGSANYTITELTATTTGTSPVYMTDTLGRQGVVIPQNSVASFELTVIGRSTNGNTAVYKFSAAVKRDADPATVVLLGNVTPQIVSDDLISTLWSTDLSVDVSAGAVNVRVSASAGSTTKWSTMFIMNIVSI